MVDRRTVRGARVATSLATVLCALAVAPAYAQSGAETPEDEAADTAASATGAREVDDIIVTARRRSERLIDVPVAATALSGAALQNSNITDMQKLAQSVPQLNINKGSTGSGTSIYLRGIGSTSQNVSFDQAVSVNIDGVQVSRGRAATQSYFDLERIEVLKGPQALFFGKNSPAGIISFSSANPGNSFEASAAIGYEFEARQMYGEGFVSGPIADGIGVRLAVRASVMEGYFKNQARPFALGVLDPVIGSSRGNIGRKRGPVEEELAARLTLQFDRGGPFTLVGKLQASTYKDNGPASYQQLGSCTANNGKSQPLRGAADPFDDCIANRTISVGTPSIVSAAGTDVARDGMPYTDYSSWTSSLTANYDFGGVTLTSITGYYDYSNQFYDTFDRSALALVFGAETENYRAWSQEVRLGSDFDGPLNFMIGAYYQNADLDTVGRGRVAAHGPDASGGTFSYIRDGGYDAEAISAFGELRYNILPSLELAGGVRYTKEDKRSHSQNVYVNAAVAANFSRRLFTDDFSDDNFSPQVTLRWKPVETVSVYGAYKTGYKSGGFDLGAILNTAFNSDAQLKFGSERAEGFEAGVKGEVFDRQLRFSLVGYSYDYSDLQVTVFDSSSTSFFVRNVGSATTEGVELDATFSPHAIPELTLNTSIAYNRARFGNYVGQCYTGQSVAAGCNLTPVGGVFREQDYTGRTLARAPKWSGNVGGEYERPLSDGLTLGFGTTATFVSSYLLMDSLRPDIRQKAYVKFDARVRLSSDAGWEFSFIGRNLFDKIVTSSASDRPLSGSGSGTAGAIPADVGYFVQRPRELVLQAKMNF